MAIKYLDTADFKGKKVIARFDFNVPLDKKNPSIITDTTRVDLALPTIRLILEKGANKVILMSHLGRPKSAEDKSCSLEPVAEYLSQQLGVDVFLSHSVVDGVKRFLSLPEAKIILLENLRYHPGEEANDMEFASHLAGLADFYVNDAFGAAHRKHASVHAINAFFKNKAYCGELMKKEVESLERVIHNPKKPFVAIIGGAKVSDKIKTIEKLMRSVDHLLIGGAMAYPFLKARGAQVGKSLCSDEDVKLATSLLRVDKANKIVLPLDHVGSGSFDGDATIINEVNIPDSMMGLDIGPKTIEAYAQTIATAQTIFWNGPMGLFENKNYANGTFSMAKAIAKSAAFSVVGGGDSVSAVNQSGMAHEFSHVSTGGGASLEYIENGELPGVQALKFGVQA
jgi:phosphoglycerate kinase